MFEAIVQAMGNSFSPEQYLFWTRIECAAWTAADMAIVFYLIRLGNVARTAVGLGRHVFSYVALALTIPPALLIPFAPTGRLVLAIELVVTLPHFAVILYIIARDARPMAAALKLLTTNSKSTSEIASSLRSSQ